MPELPEIHRFATLINDKWCYGQTFQKIEFSDGAKYSGFQECSYIGSMEYRISAAARGKQLRLTLQSSNDTVPVVVGHGLVGHWEWVPLQETFIPGQGKPKGTQVSFITSSGTHALCYVDVQRMGSLKFNAEFDMSRSPDPVDDFARFKSKLISSASSRTFDKPICELMLDQQYFNGIGNYLRAEILHRANVNPFTSAKQIFKDVSTRDKLLDCCHNVPNEVITMQLYKYGDAHQKAAFQAWLQCYQKLLSKTDSKGRKIFYSAAQLAAPSPSAAVFESAAPSWSATQPAQSAPSPNDVSEDSWMLLNLDAPGPKPLTHLLLAVSILYKRSIISPQVRGWVKTQGLRGDELVFCVLEAFLADDCKDFLDLADSFSRLHRIHA